MMIWEYFYNDVQFGFLKENSKRRLSMKKLFIFLTLLIITVIVIVVIALIARNELLSIVIVYRNFYLPCFRNFVIRNFKLRDLEIF
jgi:hypothetical protein